jgi:tetratricopeptide (TPR) repeat protein
MSEKEAGTGTARSLKLDLAICTVLIMAVLIVYHPVGRYGFTDFDDPDYVSANPHVSSGITVEGLVWAMGFPDKHYWTPLSMISHMLDCELFGLNPGMHHLVNVAFHILNSLLLFFVLKTMTGARWRSAFVAALFALHPVNVDSVAWIAERKNLLSTSFWLLSMIAYYYYTQKRVLSRYALLMAVFTLGLLAKQMLVTLPFVFLMLDYWPLGRIAFARGEGDNAAGGNLLTLFRGEPVMRLVIEKLPLIVLSLAAIVISSQSIAHVGSTVTFDTVPLGLRIENAIVSYLLYAWKMIWPVDLMFYYPYPNAIPLWQVAGAAGIMALVTAAAGFSLFRAPFFLVGWLWFVGTLVPVSGLIQGGLWPAIAERWAYVPYIGLFLVISWGMPGLLGVMKVKRNVLPFPAGIVLLALAALTVRQVGFWKDDITLFSHALGINSNNIIAHAKLGDSYANAGRKQEAMHHYAKALELHPASPIVLRNLGQLHHGMGNLDEAVDYLSRAVRYDPEDISAHMRLGTVYAEREDLDNAIRHFSLVVELDPGQAEAYYNLGILRAKKGDIARAAEDLSRAVELHPGDTEAHCSYGIVLMNQGRVKDAIAHFERALVIDPNNREAAEYLRSARAYAEKIRSDAKRLEQESRDNPEDSGVLGRLAVYYSMAGDNEKALDVLNRLLGLQPDNPDVYYNIACISAKQGKTDDALKWLADAVDRGFRNRELMQVDRDLDSIRNTPQYRSLLESMQNKQQIPTVPSDPGA